MDFVHIIISYCLLFNLIVLLFGSVGEWSPVIIFVLSLHPEANGELQQVGHEPVQ